MTSRDPAPRRAEALAPPAESRDGVGTARVFSPRAALVLLGLVILVWGLNWPIMKMTLTYIPPITFGLVRLVLGALCLAGLLVALGRFRVPGRRDLPIVLSVGVFQLAAFLAFIHLGLQYLSAGRSVILCYTTLIWVTPLAVVVLGERLTPLKTAGFLAGLGGFLALFAPQEIDWSDRAALFGNGLLVAAALSWAVAILHVRGHRFGLSPLQLAPWQMLVAIVPLALLALLWESDRPIIWGGPLVAALAFNGPLATAFALWAWLSVARALPAISTSIGSLGVPVVGLLSSALLLGESITPAMGAGFLLIVAGLALISVESARGRGVPPPQSGAGTPKRPLRPPPETRI